MRNIKLVIEYDGTNYCGWQIQNRKANKSKHKTLQGTIEKTLKKILKEKVSLIASGRTDSGVHARGQVASFKVKSSLPAKNIQKALNSLLLDDISILDAKDVPLDFHARFFAKTKTYRYLILNQDCPSALLRNYCYRVSYKLDITKMRKAAKLLLGRHDFKAFCASGSSVKNTVRTIKKIIINRKYDWRIMSHTSQRASGNWRLICIDIQADGFLYNMVRSIVGTLIEIGRGKIELTSIRNIIDYKKRYLVGPTVPAQGLCLLRVDY